MADLYADGIGAPTGDPLAVYRPLLVGGLIAGSKPVWYVNSAIGVDGAAPAGTHRGAPLATLEQALVNANDDDIIVLLDGHAQVVTATIVVSKGVAIIGEGLSDGLPTAKLTNDQAASPLFQITNPRTSFGNLWIAENLQSCTAPRISVEDTDCYMRGMYFPCGANDLDGAVALESGVARFRCDTSRFVATSTAIGSRPLVGLAVRATTELSMDGTIFDAGPVGWSDWAFDNVTAGAASLLPIRAENMSLLRGAIMAVGGNSRGYVQVGTATGGGRVDWPIIGGGPTLRSFPNGLGPQTGTPLVVAKDLFTSGTVYYVSSQTGSDASLSQGKNRQDPLATLAFAMTLVADDDFIVVEDGHLEDFTAVVDYGVRVVVLCGGRDSLGRPTAKFTNDQAAAIMFDVTAEFVEMRGMWFTTNKQPCTAARIQVPHRGFKMVDCYMETAGNDQAAGLLLNNSIPVPHGHTILQRCSFVSTAVDLTDRGAAPLASANTSSGPTWVFSCVFDGGTYGFYSSAYSYYAFNMDNSGMDALRVEDATLIDGADAIINANSSGWFNAQTTSGSAEVRWPDTEP